MRGNETQPTKMAGRILLAQFERLPDSELIITSSAKPVDVGSARGRKRIGVSSVPSPSPRPLPWGGNAASCVFIKAGVAPAGTVRSAIRGRDTRTTQRARFATQRRTILPLLGEMVAARSARGEGGPP